MLSKRVGLTGGIGSGKTTVSQMFAKLGIPIYNSDNEAKKLMESSVEIRVALEKLFNGQAYIDGRINRIFISEQIFKNKSLLESINAIVHPKVRQDFLNWSERQNAVYVIQEAAIIFETASQNFYDKTILVTAPEHLRIRRIKNRDANYSTNDIRSRIKNQWKDKDKIALSDFVIENYRVTETEIKVLNVHHKLLDLFKMH